MVSRWVLAFILAVTAVATAQTTWHVAGPGTIGMGSGTVADPFHRIQDAIDAASSGDTILVRPGYYLEQARHDIYPHEILEDLQLRRDSSTYDSSS